MNLPLLRVFPHLNQKTNKIKFLGSNRCINTPILLIRQIEVAEKFDTKQTEAHFSLASKFGRVYSYRCHHHRLPNNYPALYALQF